MTFHESTVDGKRIAYTSETEFLVEVGHGAKGGYRTRYRTVGNLAQAVGLYNAVNIGNGYKKRLRCPSFNRPVLARSFSH